MPEPAPPSAHEEFSALLTRAFPDLTEAERMALLRACGHLRRWIDRLPRDLAYEDEPAHVFVAPGRTP
ncbi:MAG: hypothetical protein ACM3O6_04310 [Acidobacteriota bacterium]